MSNKHDDYWKQILNILSTAFHMVYRFLSFGIVFAESLINLS